jgi:hypothetical protein
MKNNIQKLYTNTGKITGALMLCIALSACPSKHVATEETEEVANYTPRHEVQLQLTKTGSYCGGAAPPQALLDELATPKPLSGVQFYIRKGTANKTTDPVIADGTTLPSGVISLLLEEGEYYLVFMNKVSDRYYNEIYEKYKNGDANHAAIDKVCFDNWLSTPDLAFTVKNDAANIFMLNVNEPCPWNEVPCAKYTGPYPP